MSRYASVYPLVTTRALSRPFTYEAPDEVQLGSVVSVRLGGAKQRGVVIEVDEAPPAGIVAAPIEGIEESLPPALVELALWVADYYGSTRAGRSRSSRRRSESGGKSSRSRPTVTRCRASPSRRT